MLLSDVDLDCVTFKQQQDSLYCTLRKQPTSNKTTPKCMKSEDIAQNVTLVTRHHRDLHDLSHWWCFKGNLLLSVRTSTGGM